MDPADPFAPQKPKMTKDDELMSSHLLIAAAHAANYYAALKDQGVPENLAYSLVESWHMTYWETYQPEEELD